jgi:hypothetical protein
MFLRKKICSIILIVFVFMSELSKKCNISQIYPNNSIRPPGATVLANNIHGAAQNMAVTGRKSVQSLTTYQRVDTGDKIKMMRTLSENLVQEPKLKRQALPSRATLALPSTTYIENIPPRTIIQDLVPVNSGNRPVIVSNPSTSSTFMDHPQDIDICDILVVLGSDAPVPIQNRQTNMQSNPQIFCQCYRYP